MKLPPDLRLAWCPAQLFQRNGTSARNAGALSTERVETVTKSEFAGTHSDPVKRLARILYEKMEHLDPGSCGGESWDELSPHARDYYALCVEAMVEQGPVLRAALTDDNVILRETK